MKTPKPQTMKKFHYIQFRLVEVFQLTLEFKHRHNTLLISYTCTVSYVFIGKHNGYPPVEGFGVFNFHIWH